MSVEFSFVSFSQLKYDYLHLIMLSPNSWVIMELNTSNSYSGIIPTILDNKWIEKQLDDYGSFRTSWSPRTRWHHRRPTVSPIVPILYWNLREMFQGFQEPFGFWGGHPEEILSRIGEEIDGFRDFWEALPDSRGTDNLKWALTNPQRFFSISHELTTSHFMASRPEVQVEPLFLDPKSNPGKPDFIVRTPHKEFAVQCKSEDPSAASQLPYDIFQYFAGTYQRLVEDSGKSYHLTLVLKKNLDLGHMNKIRNRLATIIGKRLTIPYPWSTTYCDFELTEIGTELGARSIYELRRMTLSRKGDPLYHEFVPMADNILDAERRRGSILFIFGKRRRELYQFIQSAVAKSVQEASTSLPLIIAVHLYQDIDLEEFWNRSSTQQNLKPWTDQFFKDHPQVAMIYLSSNNELYVPRLVNEDQVGIKWARQGYVLESPEWDHNDVKELGF